MVDYKRAFSTCALAASTAAAALATSGCAVAPVNSAPCAGMLVVPKTSYNEYQLRRNNSWFNWASGVDSVEVPTAQGPVLMLIPRTVDNASSRTGDTLAGAIGLLAANQLSKNVKDPTARTAILGIGALGGVAYGGPAVNQSIDNVTAPFRQAQLAEINSCTARIVREYGAPVQGVPQFPVRPTLPGYQYPR